MEAATPIGPLPAKRNPECLMFQGRAWRIFFFCNAFILVYTTSSAYSADGYVANSCNPVNVNVETISVINECRFNDQTPAVGPSCLYKQRRAWAGDHFYYACPYGGDWAAEDVDQDGLANGVDDEPYVPFVAPAGDLPEQQLDIVVSGVSADATIAFSKAFAGLALIISLALAIPLFRKFVRAASR